MTGGNADSEIEGQPGLFGAEGTDEGVEAAAGEDASDVKG